MSASEIHTGHGRAVVHGRTNRKRQREREDNAATKAALQPLLAYGAAFDENTRGHEAAIPALAGVSAIANRLTLRWIGTAHGGGAG